MHRVQAGPNAGLDRVPDMPGVCPPKGSAAA